MRRFIHFFVIIVVLGSLFSIPKKKVDRVRDFFVSLVVLPWNFSHKKVLVKTENLDTLRLENYQLKEQLQFLQTQLDLEEVIQEKRNNFQNLKEDRRKEEILHQLHLYTQGVTAKVIFREAPFWSSCFWINVGEEANESLKTLVVEINSPVVLGTSVVGMVDYVGKKRARVRCITDSSVVPSVRVLRAGENTKTLYLAKGELQGVLQGSAQFLWRGKQPVLQGVGFNLAFDDAEGPAQNLTSNLVQEGDLLVTTGFDGVFPKGLEVAYVTKVYPLPEGGVSYDLEARPLIDNFDSLSFVTVLPSINEES